MAKSHRVWESRSLKHQKPAPPALGESPAYPSCCGQSRPSVAGGRVPPASVSPVPESSSPLLGRTQRYWIQDPPSVPPATILFPRRPQSWALGGHDFWGTPCTPVPQPGPLLPGQTPRDGSTTRSVWALTFSHSHAVHGGGAQRLPHPSPPLAFLPEAFADGGDTRRPPRTGALCAGLCPATGEGPPNHPTVTLLPTWGTRAQPSLAHPGQRGRYFRVQRSLRPYSPPV